VAAEAEVIVATAADLAGLETQADRGTLEDPGVLVGPADLVAEVHLHP
jgi:hypothetical protein